MSKLSAPFCLLGSILFVNPKCGSLPGVSCSPWKNACACRACWKWVGTLGYVVFLELNLVRLAWNSRVQLECLPSCLWEEESMLACATGFGNIWKLKHQICFHAELQSSSNGQVAPEWPAIWDWMCTECWCPMSHISWTQLIMTLWQTSPNEMILPKNEHLMRKEGTVLTLQRNERASEVLR